MAGAITMAVVDEYGPSEMLRRSSDPWWFQAFGSVLGFDWQSSGVTTVTCGAMKEAARTLRDDLGIMVAGGKDGTPFPVDCETYDRNIEILHTAIRRARLGDNDRFRALKKLGDLSCDEHRLQRTWLQILSPAAKGRRGRGLLS